MNHQNNICRWTSFICLFCFLFQSKIFLVSWTSISFLLFSGIKLEKYSCYTGRQDIILCSGTGRISIYDLQYARNCSLCQCDDSKSICKQFILPGSWENYYYYNAVSGTQSSQFTTQRTPCPNSGTGRIYTNQVHLRYECVPGEFIFTELANSFSLELEGRFFSVSKLEMYYYLRICCLFIH